MTWLQAIVLAVVQGISELFPVSSLGHAVVLPALLGWNVDQASETFLPFLVVMHLGTAVALFAFFWRDWFQFGQAVLLNRGPRPAQERRLFWRVVVATIPAVIVGAALHKVLKSAFATPLIAAAFLIVNGFILFATERLNRPARKPLDQLTWADALIVGCWQCLALIPGVSRSGSTIVGGLIQGLDHEESARFSFLAAVPVILGATVLEAPKLLHAHEGQGVLAMSLVAGVVSGVVAWISLSLLMRWFKQHDFKALDPFAYYCWAAGLVSLAVLMLRR